MYMKMKTKIFIVLLCVLFVGVMLAVKTAERNGSDMLEQSYNILVNTKKEQLHKHNAAAEGNAVYDENAQSGTDKNDQLFTDYVESVKEIFKGNEHLLE